jgi:hypothetical protein
LWKKHLDIPEAHEPVEEERDITETQLFIPPPPTVRT